MNNFILLRNIISHVEIGGPSIMGDHENYMSRGFNPLTRQGYGLARAAGTDLHRLAQNLFAAIPGVKRQIAYNELVSFLAGHILHAYNTKKDEPINASDLANIERTIITWLKDNCSARQVFVPCLISIYPAASFSVGPVKFDFIDNFTKPAETTSDFNPFPDILDRMRVEEALWMATVNLPPCSDNYGYELAELCVDLALTGLQLVVPTHYSRSICRMFSKRTANATVHTTVANGALGQRRSTEHAGFLLGPGSLEEFINASPRMLPSTGERIRVYLGEGTAVPVLEMAWCDASYWYHEGLAEPVDSIATVKLETALEVLLRATSTKAARPMLKRAIRFTFEIDEDEDIFKNPIVLAKDFVEKIIEIRSRVLHGDLSTLDTETSSIRAQLEKFVGIMLQVYTLELDNYILQPDRVDDVGTFFAWSERHRESNSNSRFSTGWKGKTASR